MPGTKTCTHQRPDVRDRATVETDRDKRLAAAEVSEGERQSGVRVRVVCLCTVKGQIYVQPVLNQMCIPPLTQHTQTRKYMHTYASRQ